MARARKKGLYMCAIRARATSRPAAAVRAPACYSTVRLMSVLERAWASGLLVRKLGRSPHKDLRPKRLREGFQSSLPISFMRAIDTAETIKCVQLILQCTCYLVKYDTPMLQLCAWRASIEWRKCSHPKPERLHQIIPAQRGTTCSLHQYRAQHACYLSMVWSRHQLSPSNCWSDPRTVQTSPLDGANLLHLAQGFPAPAQKRVSSC